MEECERYVLIDDDGYAFACPAGLKPAYWLGPLHASVHGLPMSDEQRRTDDYRRNAEVYRLECEIVGDTEADMHQQAGTLRWWVRRARWLQRDGRAALRLLDGSDITLAPTGGISRIAKLGVEVVAQNRKWIHPLTGQEVTG
jgi:hypothetical protein